MTSRMMMTAQKTSRLPAENSSVVSKKKIIAVIAWIFCMIYCMVVER